MTNSVENFLKESKLSFKLVNDNYQIDCFLCSDTRGRLGIHQTTGKFYCFNCTARGSNVKQLKYAFDRKGTFKTKDQIVKSERERKCSIPNNIHIRYHKQIYKTKENNVARYLIKDRKISREAIKFFKLGHRSTFKTSDGESYTAGEHLAIPYLKDGACVNLKYRNLDPECDKKYKWRREKGGISALYNDDVLDNFEYTEIIIAESEIDAISIWELGYKNVIGLTAGSDSFLQSWYDRLERFEKIYLVLDNDIAGQEGSKKISKRLGMGRCYNVQLPEDVKDPNDFIKKYDVDRFKSILNKAKKFEVEDSMSLRTIIDDIYRKRFLEKNEEVSGYTTQYRKLNAVSGPLKEGYLVVVAGRPKTGKSSLVINWFEHWASKRIPVGFYSCEMRSDRIGEKLAVMSLPTIDKVENAEASQILTAKYRLPIDYLYFYYPKPGDLEIEKVCEKITEMVQRYGIKIFCFDNLHFLCRGDDDNAKIDSATQAFKLLAESLNIVFILVVHPRKTQNSNKQLTNDDLKGSSSIYQDADVIYLINRPDMSGDLTPDEVHSGLSEGAKSPRTDFRVTSRWFAGGKTFLVFHEDRGIFSDKGILYNKVARETDRTKKRKSF